MITQFNIRVYFLLFNDKNDVLLSDEIIKGNAYTKFPGGGLEKGEGTIDCMKREAMEELGQPVQVLWHFYTTDFFLPSAFNPAHQVISIYYTAKLEHEQRFVTSDERFHFKQTAMDEEAFRWQSIAQLHEEHFSFAADRVVAQMLMKQFCSLP